MSKTFKSAVPSSTQTLVVRKDHDGTAVYVRTEDSGRLIAGIVLERTDAPAIALAILEAAGIAAKGFSESSDAEMAVAHLASHVGLERAKAKEAADREALEREALALCNAFQDAGGYEKSDVMTTHHYDYGKWMDAARKARELHGSTK